MVISLFFRYLCALEINLRLMEEDLVVQLRELQKLFADAAPEDGKIIEEYAWTICKVLNRNSDKLSSLYCRQLLAEYMKLDVAKPSLLHSAMLNAAVKVATESPDFHFSCVL